MSLDGIFDYEPFAESLAVFDASLKAIIENRIVFDLENESVANLRSAASDLFSAFEKYTGKYYDERDHRLSKREGLGMILDYAHDAIDFEWWDDPDFKYFLPYYEKMIDKSKK